MSRETPVIIQGLCAELAYDAIASQDLGLVPGPKIPTMGELVAFPQPSSSVGYFAVKGGPVEWRSGLIYSSPDPYEDDRDRQALTVHPEAQPALIAGLQEFAKGPRREDLRENLTRLRVGAVYTAVRRRFIARRMLEVLGPELAA